MAILVGLVEDERVLIDAVSKVFHTKAQARLVGVASSRAQIPRLLAVPEMDVLLLDLGLPDVDGMDLVAEFKARFPSIKIVVLTTYSDQRHVLNCFKLGVDGYLLKSEPVEALMTHVINVTNGHAPMSSLVSGLMLRKFREIEENTKPATDVEAIRKQFNLTDREWRALQLLSDGFSIEEMSTRMMVSTHTVNLYLRGIYKKLNVSSRSRAVAVAISHGLLNS